MNRMVIYTNLSLSGSTSIIGEATEGDAVLVADDIVEVGLSTLEGETLESVTGLTSVLEVNTEVRAASLDAPKEREGKEKVERNKGRKMRK
jgi:hypothetical protein